MKSRPVYLGVLLSILLLVPIASGKQEENYLLNVCESIIPGDFITSLEISDVENKGTWNILAGTSYNGVLYNFVYDSSTDCYNEWSPKSTFTTNGDIEEIVVKDADQDGVKEIILNGAKSKKDKSPDKYVFVLSMKDDSLLSRWGYDKECGFSNSVDSADIHNLGEHSIIIGTESKKVCAIVNWSANKKQLLWSSPLLDNPVEYIIADDFNLDGDIEIMALTKRWYDASIYMLDKNGQILWRHQVSGGVRTIESKNIWVDDLNNDGKLEIIVGTIDHGVDVVDHNGNLKWNYKTGSGSTADIVSKVRTYNYFTGDETPKIVVAAKPYIYLLDNNGKLLWKSRVNMTVFDFDYGDIDGDGRNELVAGGTSYISIYGDGGQLEGAWSYVAEIQGMTGVYKKRDMDTVKVGVYDFDNDGKQEILAAFKWFDDQLDLNVPQGSIRIFELNPDYKKPLITIPTSRIPLTQATEATTQATTTLPEETIPGTGISPPSGDLPGSLRSSTTTLPGEDEDNGGMCCCIPLLPAAIALAAVLLAGLPLAVDKK